MLYIRKNKCTGGLLIVYILQVSVHFGMDAVITKYYADSRQATTVSATIMLLTILRN